MLTRRVIFNVTVSDEELLKDIEDEVLETKENVRQLFQRVMKNYFKENKVSVKEKGGKGAE